MTSSRAERLLTLSPLRAIIALALPTTAVMVLGAMSGIVNTYFVARLGADAKRAEELALAFGSGHVMQTDQGMYVRDGILCVEATRRGVPAFTFETGEGGKLEPDLVADGGIQSGQDVFKAIALGAKSTYIGRSMLYGLGALGERGVTRALELIHKELETTMGLCGVRTVAGISRDNLVPGTLPA